VTPPFTCGHCSEVVPPVSRRGKTWPRNHCPACLWSKHLEFGEQVGQPPCGAMMRGTDVGGDEVAWRCLGCGFMMRGPTDDYLHRVLSGGLRTRATYTFYPRDDEEEAPPS
jgi:hypothetical protein